MKKTTAVALATLCLVRLASAEVTQGVLEKGPAYSALFSASPESGDLIGFTFKTQSAVGRAILQNCLPGLLCKIEKSATRPVSDALSDTLGQKFAAQPAGWIEIIQARDIGMAPVVFGYEKTLKTRYGMVSVREEDNTLLFKGKPIKPAIEGNSGLDIVANYEMGATDVLLLQSSGGTACPALFRFVNISPGGVLRVAPEFGTCSDIIYPTFDSKVGVTVAMVGFRGPFEPAAEQKKAAMSKTVYRWNAQGQLRDNGKPVR
ncbi:MAG TPA: hypothetical protein PLE22_05525 [Acidovorax sp.]|jgi:hypothetical protein|nr:hypothetical protein [Acidovorax sp.]